MRFALTMVVLSSICFTGCDCAGPVVQGDGGGLDGSHDSGRGSIDGARPDGGGGCGLVTCASSGASCGLIGDGCGHVLDCGSCAPPMTCGGGGVASQCGGASGCVPRSCTDQNIHCGPAGDGCGGMLDCGGCTAPETCGGGGVASTCGTGVGVDAGVCAPETCTSLGVHCGPAGDGCGGLLDCGGCATGETCGGSGTHGVCGAPTTVCVPRTCAAATCGPIGDGCGGMLDCGPCTAPMTCGGGGVPSVCGGSTGCVPRTCAAAGASCGAVADGCGGLLDCGGCTAPATCGGGGVPFQCGAPMGCVARTCASVGATCGPVADGCGGITPSCGTCTAPTICGGSGVPNQCGAGVDAGVPCTGLCTRVPTCSGGATTVISGIVTAPGHADTATWGFPDPLYGATVYVPNGPVAPFTPGVSCDQCGAPLSGNPLVSAITGPDGRFALTGVPAGANIPLVIQLGRWRRQVTIPNVNPCVDNPLGNELTRLPRNHLEGDIPLMAMVTGDVDIMECVLRKIGIDDAEFSVPAAQGGTGRVRFYVANGADINNPPSATAPSETQLFSAGGDVNQYDMVMFACEGRRLNESAADQQRMIDYANVGGRIFATHFSYVWLTNHPSMSPIPFSQTASWLPNQGNTSSVLATVDTSFPRGMGFAQWLVNVGASATLGQVTVNVVRHDFDSVVAPAQRWLYVPTHPLHYTFNTPIAYPPLAPVPPAQQCGRVLFSDFHVTDFGGAGGMVFPSECTDGPMTPQERVLEFMLFDLASCITPDVPTCTPTTCAAAGASCGPIGDGCGGVIASCGTCAAPDTCGGGGTPSVCGHVTCMPRSCAAQGISCGPAGDGCGGTLSCGSCTVPDTCGGGGTRGVCGHSSCTPRTCASLGISCGPAGDGCGGTLSCGTCTAPDTCGGGGVPGVCGHNVGCTPASCASLGVSCGPAGDGCGGALSCGTCTAPDTCGGGGRPGVCGHVACAPLSCAAQGLMCGPAGDGCGGALDCGPCTAPDTCGGGGTPGVCGHSSCVPRTCAGLPSTFGAVCGPVADGCGGTVDCGPCPTGMTCGGGGHANQCGAVF